tara:strand:+ start:16583 stop:17833 length:1251 start_codon:yes stop_codon:yes gene_type:complete
MAGGLMQLVAYGAQDVYLTGNPEVTFYQAKYKRHTNFAMENIEQTLNGNPGNSGRVSVTVARNGDLVGEMYVELESNAQTDGVSCWVAERAVSSVELSIGGQRVDKLYQKYWRLYSELYYDEAKKSQYGKMTTAGDGNKVFLPLLFFFNRNPGLALPLIALQYHEVRVDFDLASDFTTYCNPGTFKVYANYIYLDTEERRRFAQKGHEYLIEQTQHTGVDTVDPTGTKQIRLSFNHPVKSLMWCLTGTSADSLWSFGKAVGQADVLELSAGPSSVSTTVGDQALPVSAATGAPVVVTAGHANRLAFTEEAQGAMTDFKLVLNGQDRFKAQGGKYFNQVQPYHHFSGSPFPGVYAYSFALKPEEHQPTGTCNFSRIDNAQVSITTASAANATNLHMFATNYNVLRIQSGMGGLAFSN